MTRPILQDQRIHPAIREQIEGLHRQTIEQVEQAIAAHAVVVVGMRQNPYPKQARKALQSAGIPHHYLEFGSYFSEWQRRGALKRWSGWPTLPMVFVKGVLVGGAADLKRLIDSGELRRLVG